jgi:5'-3' exonuclease
VREKVGAGIATRLEHPDARAAYELNCRVMAMHDDVPIELDLSSGTGVLPFDAQTVDTIYRAHNLTWSAAQAVRVLADVEALETAPPRPVPTWVAPGLPRRTPRPPVTVPRRPVVEQLSLFE